MILHVFAILLTLAEVTDPQKIKVEGHRPLPQCVPPFFGSESQWGAIEDGSDRRELFDFWGTVFQVVTTDVWGEIESWATQAWEDVKDTVEDAVEAVVTVAEDAKEELEKVAEDAKDAFQDLGEELEKVGMEALDAFEDGLEGIKGFMEDIAGVFCMNMDSCMTDIEAEGCLPGADSCIITYGKNCLKLNKGEPLFEVSASEQRQFAIDHEYVEASGNVEVSGGAEVSVGLAGAVQLRIEEDPSIRVMITPPDIQITAEVAFELQADLEANLDEQRINLSPPKEVYKRVFMAGYVPVLIVMRVQPIAHVSAHGTVSASGEALLKASGNLKFDRDLWMELNLKDFHAAHNFIEVTPDFNGIDEEWSFDFEAEAELELVGKIGVEVSFTLYDVIEFNFLPQFTAQINAEGHIAVSGSGTIDSAEGSASAAATTTLCIGADIGGYFDWVDHVSKTSRRGINRKPKNNGRRLLNDFQIERRELGEVDFGQIILESCEAVIQVFDCDAMEVSIRALCGVTIEGLRLINFPLNIDMPDIPDLSLPSIPIPATCFTWEVDFSAEVELKAETAQKRGYQCGGFFSGTTAGMPNIHGNSAGDAIHTFIAGSSEIIVDACKSTYDSYIRVFGYEVNYLNGKPYVTMKEIATNDDHDGECGDGHKHASHLHLTDLVPGATYFLLVEGFGNNEGNYHVNLKCPNALRVVDLTERCIWSEPVVGSIAKNNVICYDDQSVASCKEMCEQEPECESFDYKRSTNHCCLGSCKISGECENDDDEDYDYYECTRTSSNVISFMVYGEGNLGNIGTETYTGIATGLNPETDYVISFEILQNDLASPSEKVLAATVDGTNILEGGECNPDGDDFDCTFFDCAMSSSDIVRKFTASSVPLEITLTGHSRDCDCVRNDDPTKWQCYKENTHEGATPMMAVGRFTFTPQEVYDISTGGNSMELTIVVVGDPMASVETIDGNDFDGAWEIMDEEVLQFHDRPYALSFIPQHLEQKKFWQGPCQSDGKAIRVKTSGVVHVLASVGHPTHEIDSVTFPRSEFIKSINEMMYTTSYPDARGFHQWTLYNHGVDRNGQVCADWCFPADSGEFCDACGIHHGHKQLCCQEGSAMNHPNCETAIYNGDTSRHQCVHTPLYKVEQSTEGCQDDNALTETECSLLDEEDFGEWGGIGSWDANDGLLQSGHRYFNHHDSEGQCVFYDNEEMSICKASRDCAELTVHATDFAAEMYWYIDRPDDSGYNLCYGSQGWYEENYKTYDTNCCLKPGTEILVICKDSYGDGWHGSYLEINGKKYCEDFTDGKEFEVYATVQQSEKNV